MILRNRGGQAIVLGIYAYFLTGLLLCGNIGFRGGVIADEDDTESRYNTFFGKVGNVGPELCPHIRGDLFSVYYLRSHCFLRLSGDYSNPFTFPVFTSTSILLKAGFELVPGISLISPASGTINSAPL